MSGSHLRDSAVKISGQRRQSSPAAGVPPQGVRVLLIENDERGASLVRACLAGTGIGADALLRRRTLADGLRAHELHRPECVLLALDLPDADGVGALVDIVTAAPDTPVIVLNEPAEEAGTTLLAEGAEDYLIKEDLTGELLDRSIRYSIERKRSQRARRRLLRRRGGR